MGTVFQGLRRPRIGNVCHLQVQHADHELQVVIGPVVDLFEQQFLVGVCPGQLVSAFVDPSFQVVAGILQLTVEPGVFEVRCALIGQHHQRPDNFRVDGTRVVVRVGHQDTDDPLADAHGH